MKSLSRENQADIIEAFLRFFFNSTSRYLDDVLNIDNIYFDQTPIKQSKFFRYRKLKNHIVVRVYLLH